MNWEEVEEIFAKNDFEDMDDSILLSHYELTDRICKTMHYAPQKNPAKDTMSFAVTKVAVETFRKAAPTPCGKLGHRCASRIVRDACPSPCAMLLAMIYIERLSCRNPEYLQNISSSDLFLVSMLVASKFLQDEGVQDEAFNDEWAASGLVDTDHVNQLEAEFLHAIDWRVWVRKGEFHRELQTLEARMAFSEYMRRGWLTYTDASCIVASQKVMGNMKKMIRLISKAMWISALMYSGLIVASMSLVAALQTIGFASDNVVSSQHHMSVETTNLSSTARAVSDSTHSLGEDAALTLDLEAVSDDVPFSLPLVTPPFRPPTMQKVDCKNVALKRRQTPGSDNTRLYLRSHLFALNATGICNNVYSICDKSQSSTIDDRLPQLNYQLPPTILPSLVHTHLNHPTNEIHRSQIPFSPPLWNGPITPSS